MTIPKFMAGIILLMLPVIAISLLLPRTMTTRLYSLQEHNILPGTARGRSIPGRWLEPFYYLGVALKGQGRYDEAYTAFYKATWKEEWKSPGYFSLAEIATMKGEFAAVMNFINRSLDANAYNVRAYALKSAILRNTNHADEAAKVVALARQKCDPLDVQLMAEQWLAYKRKNCS